MSESKTREPELQASRKSHRLQRLLLATLSILVVGGLLLRSYRYQQQMALIERIEAAGGAVETKPWGPEWMRQTVGAERMRGLEHIEQFRLGPVNRSLILRELTHRGISQLVIQGGDLKAEDVESLLQMDSLFLLGFEDFTKVAEEDVKAISGHQTLSSIYFRKCSVPYRSLDHLKSQPNLYNLALYDSTLSGNPGETFRSFSNLEVLNCQGSSLTDDDFERLGDLSHQCVVLNVEGTQISDESLQFIGNYERLRQLQLSGTKITDSGLQHLRDLQSLKHLELDCKSISDTGLVNLEGLKNLKVLYLPESAITEQGLDSLARFKNLQELHVTVKEVTHEIIDKLQTKLPKCKIIYQER